MEKWTYTKEQYHLPDQLISASQRDKIHQSTTTRHTDQTDSQHDTNLRTIVFRNNLEESLPYRNYDDRGDLGQLQDLGRFSGENKLLQDANEELKLIIHELQIKLQQTSEQLYQARATGSSQVTLNRIEEEVNQLKKQYEESLHKNSALLAQKEQLERSLGNLTSEMSSNFAILRAERDKEAAIQARNFVGDISAARERHLAAEAQINLLQTQCKNREDEIIQTSSQLERARSDRDLLALQEQNFRAENAQLKAQINLLESQSQQHYFQNDREVNALREAVRKLEHELSLRRGQITALESRKAIEIRQANQTLQAQLNDLRNFNSRLRTEVQLVPSQVRIVTPPVVVSREVIRPVSGLIAGPIPYNIPANVSYNAPLRLQTTTQIHETSNNTQGYGEVEKLRVANAMLKNELAGVIAANEQGVARLESAVRSRSPYRRV